MQAYNIESESLKILALREKMVDVYWAVGGFNQATPAVLDLESFRRSPPGDLIYLPAGEIKPAVRRDEVGAFSRAQRQGAVTALDENWYVYPNVVDTDYPFHSRVAPTLPAPLAATHLQLSLTILPELLPTTPFTILALFSHVIVRPDLPQRPTYSGGDVTDQGLLHWLGYYPPTTLTTPTTYYLFL